MKPLEVGADLAMQCNHGPKQGICGWCMADAIKAALAAQRVKDIEIAETTPFRAHHKDDVDFHSGCEQTRDRIVAALKAQEV